MQKINLNHYCLKRKILKKHGYKSTILQYATGKMEQILATWLIGRINFQTLLPLLPTNICQTSEIGSHPEPIDTQNFHLILL